MNYSLSIIVNNIDKNGFDLFGIDGHFPLDTIKKDMKNPRLALYHLEEFSYTPFKNYFVKNKGTIFTFLSFADAKELSVNRINFVDFVNIKMIPEKEDDENIYTKIKRELSIYLQEQFSDTIINKRDNFLWTQPFK